MSAAALAPLLDYRMVYVATPYSKYPEGLDKAFEHAAALTADLLRAGVKAYSPIAHTHPVALYGGIDPLDHAIWLPFDETMMRLSDCLVIAHMEGWDESYGIAQEIKFFEAAGKPVFDLDPDSLRLTMRGGRA